MKKVFVSFVMGVSCLFVGAQNNPKIELLRSKEVSDYVWVAAHRADYVFAPENSLQALENAIYFGADLIETDVRLTKDGHIVMMHDYTVDRMTNGSGRVSELTLAEIKKLQLKTNWGGSTNFQVPTLEEFIQVAKGKVCLYLDKAGYDLPEHKEGHLVKELLKILEKHNVLEETVFVLSWPYEKAKRIFGDALEKVIYCPVIEDKIPDLEAYVDEYIQRQGERINSKERPDRVYIIDSRLAWNNIPDAYAVRLTVDERIAGQRVFADKSRGSEDSYGTVEEAVEKTRQRKEGEIARYRSKYGIDLTESQNYDLIVNTSYSATEELAGIIIKGEESYRKGEEYPKNWASPACFIGTKSERQNRSNCGEAGCKPEELAQIMEDEGFDPIKGCIEVLSYKGKIFVNNGHHRCMARLASGGTLIPYRENKDPLQIERMTGDMEDSIYVSDWAYCIQEYAKAGRVKQLEDFSLEEFVRANEKHIKVGPVVSGASEGGR